MKKFITILCLLLSLHGLSQKFSASFGGSFPLTDLGGGKGEGKRFIKDLNLPATGFSVSATYHFVDFNIMIGYSHLKGADTLINNLDADNTLRYDRKQSFKTNVFEANVIYNPFLTRNLFALIGGGVFYANSIQPQIVYGGGWQFSEYVAIELLYRFTFTDRLDKFTSEYSRGNDHWFDLGFRISKKKKPNYLKCYKI